MSKKDSIDDRICSNIKSLKSYSVPQFDCSIKLDGNESPYDLYTYLDEQILKKLHTLRLNRYPDPEFTIIRSKLSKLYSVSEESILLGNGSDEIIQMLITVFTGKSGAVLTPTPTFSMYKLTSLALDKNVIETELNEQFDLDLDNIIELISKNDPDLVFLATPNNPTGNVFSDDKILTILDNTDAIVVVDEAYFDYSKQSFVNYLGDYQNLMILRTMSKIGFASLRLGVLIGDPDLLQQVNKSRLPYNINSFSQSVMQVALDNLDIINEKIDEIINERDKLQKSLSTFPEFEVYPTDANFFFIKANDADFIFNELVKQDILIRNFNRPGRLSNCIRITIGTPLENKKLIQALTGILSK